MRSCGKAVRVPGPQSAMAEQSKVAEAAAAKTKLWQHNTQQSHHLEKLHTLRPSLWSKYNPKCLLSNEEACYIKETLLNCMDHLLTKLFERMIHRGTRPDPVKLICSMDNTFLIV